MIPFDFEYYRPESVQEALATFARLENESKRPCFWGGGTEIITMARMNNIQPGAVVDLKGVPECNSLEWDGDRLVLGAAVSLARIQESGFFPLLGEAGARVADHTAQGKISLGGNLAGTISYREAALPLLLADAAAVIESPVGQRQVPLIQIFDGHLQLPRGEFLSRILVEKRYTICPYYHAKKTKIDRIDYPLLTIAALKADGAIRVALSGLCAFPFRAFGLEEALNRPGSVPAGRMDSAASWVPAPILNDLRGSAAYREFVCRRTLAEAVERLAGAI